MAESKLTSGTLDPHFEAIKDEHARVVEIAERYRQALSTLYVNAIRNPDTLAQLIAPFCDAVLNGATANEAALQLQGGSEQ